MGGMGLMHWVMVWGLWSGVGFGGMGISIGLVEWGLGGFSRVVMYEV